MTNRELPLGCIKAKRYTADHKRIEAEEYSRLVEEERLKAEEEEEYLRIKTEEESRLADDAQLKAEEHERTRLKVEE